MVFTVAGHCCCWAIVVVTASGGSWNAAPFAMASLICLYLTAPRAPTTASTATSIRIIRFIMTARLPF